MNRAIILGGGLSGLAAADKLLDAGWKVTILEHAPFLGGLASSFEMNGEQIPKYYHHIVKHNTVTQKYLARYGCMSNIVWKKVKVAIGVNGIFYNIQSPFGLLKFPKLSLWAKFRFGLFGLYTIFLMSPSKIPDELDAKTWLYKYCGREATDYIWYNLYGRNKFNIPLDRIAAKQFAYRLYEKEVYDDFMFPQRGLQPMIDGLEKDIKARGGVILVNTKIKHVDVLKKIVRTENQTFEADIIINTIPLPELLKITTGFPDEYTAKVSKVHYCPVIGLVFATKELLNNGNYWLNIFSEQVQVIMQHSWLIDKYKNKITWCVRYGGSEEDWNKTDEQIKQEYLASIRKFFPDLKPVWVKVFREKYSEPVYEKDYVKYMPDVRTPIKGVYMAGIQVTFPKIRNQNTALESGEIAAKAAIRDSVTTVQ
ncbi:MAG: FAD-dependent oxidoreductase [Candidatus Aenigmarchaeota archaeon]|nr:FAD-dependent oxidoreductase [Candidatus Aenigmarchaeota archaeon]